MSEVTANERAYNPWGWFLAYGISSVLMGWLLLDRPVNTVIALAVWLGFYSLVVGIIRIVSSFMGIGHKGSAWGWSLAAGLFSVLAGLFVLNNVLFTAVLTPIMFLYLIAFSFIINGVVVMVGGREDYAGNRNWTWGSFFLGALYIVLGLGLLGADTFNAVSTLVTVGGWALVIIGFFNIAFSFVVKREV